MSLSKEDLRHKVLETLSEQERASSVVYLDDRTLPAGSSVEIDGESHQISGDSKMAFVDLEPLVNWGHRCKYVIVEFPEGRTHTVEARFPPFLQGVPESLRVLAKGDEIPEWTLACTRPFD